MRISDDRYSRDRLRYDLAVRLISLEARTHTIRDWTGLTDDRIRKLYRAYLGDSPQYRRRRGKSPQVVSFFTRSLSMRHETTVLASLFCLFGVIPGPVPEAQRTLAGVTRGELLCQAYEAYRALLPKARISFEHAAFLIAVLTRADELRLGNCSDCGGLVVTDRLSLRNPRCTPCQEQPAEP